MDERYEVFDTLGKGVFSTVLRARDTAHKNALGKHPEVAVKVINVLLRQARLACWRLKRYWMRILCCMSHTPRQSMLLGRHSSYGRPEYPLQCLFHSLYKDRHGGRPRFHWAKAVSLRMTLSAGRAQQTEEPSCSQLELRSHRKRCCPPHTCWSVATPLLTLQAWLRR